MTSVRHLTEYNRFVVECSDAQAVLQYSLSKQDDGATAIDFSSTFVPPAARGKGIAEALVHAGIKWAKEQGYVLHASCWYVAKFIR